MLLCIVCVARKSEMDRNIVLQTDRAQDVKEVNCQGKILLLNLHLWMLTVLEQKYISNYVVEFSEIMILAKEYSGRRDGIRHKYKYLNILEQNLKQSTTKLDLLEDYYFFMHGPLYRSGRCYLGSPYKSQQFIPIDTRQNAHCKLPR